MLKEQCHENFNHYFLLKTLHLGLSTNTLKSFVFRNIRKIPYRNHPICS